MKHGGKRKGSGRKPLYSDNMVALTCLLPVELLDEIKAEAFVKHKAVAKIIRERLGA